MKLDSHKEVCNLRSSNEVKNILFHSIQQDARYRSSSDFYIIRIAAICFSFLTTIPMKHVIIRFHKMEDHSHRAKM